MKFSILVAADENGYIGKNNDLPWKGEEFATYDMRWFKEITLGHCIIMGRKTFESCGPLKDRYILVLTNNPEQEFLKKHVKDHSPHVNGVEILHNPEHPEFIMEYAMARAKVIAHGKVFICGGAEIYKQALPLADEIILTRIPGTYDGDTKFPVWPLEENGWNTSHGYRVCGIDKHLEMWYYRRSVPVPTDSFVPEEIK